MIEILIESDDAQNQPTLKYAVVFSHNTDELPTVDTFVLDNLGWMQLLDVLTKAQERAKAK